MLKKAIEKSCWEIKHLGKDVEPIDLGNNLFCIGSDENLEDIDKKIETLIGVPDGYEEEDDEISGETILESLERFAEK